jgi:hypothetical protein
MKFAYVQFLCNRIANRLVVFNILILQEQIIGYVPFLNSQVPIPSRVNLYVARNIHDQAESHTE